MYGRRTHIFLLAFFQRILLDQENEESRYIRVEEDRYADVQEVW